MAELFASSLSLIQLNSILSTCELGFCPALEQEGELQGSFQATENRTDPGES